LLAVLGLTLSASLVSASAAGPPAAGPAIGRFTVGPEAGLIGRGFSLPPRELQRRGLAPPALPPGVDLARSAEVPLVDGLVFVTSISEERGDYEAVRRVTRGQDRLFVSYSATIAWEGRPTEVRGNRVVLDRDQRNGRIYRVSFLVSPIDQPARPPELARGTTALGFSAEVLEELRTEGRTECSLASIEPTGFVFSGLGLPSPEYEGFLERVEPEPVGVPVVLDGERQWLRAIHAKGTFEGLAGDVEAEFWILDNPDNPLALRFSVGSAALLVTRIDRPAAGASTRLERALSEEELVDLPGVYFEFASARLRPESDAAIAEVSDLLKRRPDWKLRIEGHTDNVGGPEFNVTLSRQRAEAVKAAIVARLGGGAERLDTAGFGAAKPRESNETPEGRARNRRVEIGRIR
jgi:outer membrane protein OmpA-like peptidoglycan-associated protein